VQAVLLGDSFLGVRVIFRRRHLGQIAIQIPLEFIVEENANRPASAALDAGCLFLIEPVEIVVVLDLARFQQTVIDRLIVGNFVRVLEKAVASLRERYNSQGLFLRDFNGLVADERVTGKPPNIFVHPFSISAVGILREVRHRNHAELADFLDGVHLGIAEEIGPVPDVISAGRIAALLAAGMLRPNFGAIAAVRGASRGISTAWRVGKR